MKIIIMSFVVISFLFGSYAYSNCDVKDKLPLYSTSQESEVSYIGIDGSLKGQFLCQGSSMEIFRTINTLRINFKPKDCGTQGPALTPVSTAEINFEGDSSFYFDHNGNKHELEVTCSETEIFINLQDRPVTWIDPWKPGPQQWRLQLHNGKVFFDYKKFYRTIILQVKTALKTSVTSL